MKKSFKILNIKCSGCANSLEQSLKDSFSNIEIDLEQNPRVVTLEIKNEEHEQLFRKKIRSLGYPINDEELGTFSATKLKVKSFISCAVGKMS